MPSYGSTKFALILLLLAGPASACGRCLPLVHSAVYGDGFVSTLLVLLLPVLLMSFAGAAVHAAPVLGAMWRRRRRG
jgi:hypothetical protein